MSLEAGPKLLVVIVLWWLGSIIVAALAARDAGLHSERLEWVAGHRRVVHGKVEIWSQEWRLAQD